MKYKKESGYSSIDNYLYKKDDLYEHYQAFFSGIAAVCAVLLLALNHPERQPKLKINGDRNIRALLWVRTLLIVPFVMLVLYLFAKTPNKVYY